MTLFFKSLWKSDEESAQLVKCPPLTEDSPPTSACCFIFAPLDGKYIVYGHHVL